MSDLKEVTLDTVAGGAAPELFEREFARVLENINDPNTDPEQERSVTIKVKVKPHPDRDGAQTFLEVSSKLAPPAPVADLIYLGKKDGRFVAVARDPRQRDFFDAEEDEDEGGVVPIDRRAGNGS